MNMTPTPSSQSPVATSSQESWVLLDFVPLYLRDLEHRCVRPVEAYVAQFPKHERAVRREYARLESERVAQVPGESIGPYQLIRELGRGGQGVVYLAEDPRLHRQLALKVINLPPASDPSLSVARLRREAQAAGSLQHPGICTVYELGSSGHQVYLAMELIVGETLKRPESPPSAAAIRETLRVLRDAARAVHAAHEKGFVHRDLKPSNIMIRDANKSPVVLDFGVAHREDATGFGGRLTATGELVGTPSYLSPEQIAGGRIPLSRRCDVWALGVTLYELVCAKRPFVTATRAGLFQAILTKDAPSARRVNSDVGSGLETLLEVALAKDPDDRYQCAQSFADDIDRLLANRPIHARPPSSWQRLLSWVRRKPKLAAGLFSIAALLVVSVVTVTWFWRQSEESLSRERVANEQAVQRAQDLRELISEQVLGIESHLLSGEIPLGVREQLAQPMIKIMGSESTATNLQRLGLASAHYLSWDRMRPEPEDPDSHLLKAANLVMQIQGLEPSSKEERHLLSLGIAIAPHILWSGQPELANQLLLPLLDIAQRRVNRNPNDSSSQHLLALIIERAALIAGSRGEGDKERELFEALLRIKRKRFELAIGASKQAEALREIGLISARLSHALLRDGLHLDRALSLAQATVDNTAEAVAISNSAVYWSDLHSADAHLGRVYVKANDLESANFHFHRAIENLQISWIKSWRQPPRLSVMHHVAKERLDVLGQLGRSQEGAATQVILREDLQSSRVSSAMSLMKRAAQLLHDNRQPLVSALRARLLLRRVLEDRRENHPVAIALLALATARSGFRAQALPIAFRALKQKSALTPQLEFELVRLFAGRGFAAPAPPPGAWLR